MIRTEMIQQGSFLFRYRSFLPIVMVIPLAAALANPGVFYDGGHDTLASVWTIVTFGISVLGLLIRGLTIGFVPVGTSGRNTRQQIAESLNTEGLYSLVRHPLYVGNFLIWIGIFLYTGNWAVCLMFVCAYWLYYERIMAAEESFLAKKFGPVWKQWAERTPAFVPQSLRWTMPSMSFSMRTVLRREYCAVLGIGFGFAAVSIVRHALTDGRLLADRVSCIVFPATVAVFFILRFLKKHTNCLNVAGRC
ncbi:MAG: DUF1295 domain-containing protein [Planctomycetaceae bacterium]|nr:DUF1295 domain-containing protein [Planctomycetaceae bacterium]